MESIPPRAVRFNRPRVLIIDDEKDVHYSFRRLLEKEPLDILSAESGDEGVRLARKSHPDLIVMDIRMGQQSGLDTLKEIRQINPRQVVIMMTAYGTSQTAIEAMKLGAYDYVLKPFDIPHLKNLLSRGAGRGAGHEADRSLSRPRPIAEDSRQAIVGNSPAMQQVYKLIGQVAPTNTTILITGESGTGKELVARAIYQNGTRVNKPFIAINCAAIPENLLESELFGHEKGAFTGALNQRIGKFEQCDGGTLFLDEIGDMPLTTQTKILRVLQEGEISRVGSNQSLKTDVRIITATNKDLWHAVQRKEFREDLFYRLNVVRLNLPPLRERAVGCAAARRLLHQQVPPAAADRPDPDRRRRDGGHPAPSLARQRARTGKLRPARHGSLLGQHHHPGQSAGGNRPRHAAAASPRLGEPKRLSGPPRRPDLERSAADGLAPAEPDNESLARAVETLFDFARRDKQFKLLPAAERELIVRALAETVGQPGAGRQAARHHPRHPAQAGRQVRHPEAHGDRLIAGTALPLEY